MADNIPDVSDKKLEKKIAKHKKYVEKASINSAPQDFIKELMSTTIRKIKK